MADGQELKNMVMSFRASELQALLAFACRCRTGRKSELLNRALSLMKEDTAIPIQLRLGKLYSKHHRKAYKNSKEKTESDPPPLPQPPTDLLDDQNGVTPAPQSSTSQIPAPQSSISQVPAPQSSISQVSAPQSSISQVSAPQSATSQVSAPQSSTSQVSAPQSSTSQVSAPQSPTSQVPLHPDVRFKKLPFFDVFGELLKPSSLAQTTSNRLQETFFVFYLTRQQVEGISMSRDLGPQARGKYTVQIQLRFCVLETSCPQEDNFPPSVCARVNRTMATLPDLIPTNRFGVEPKRPSRPVDITSICNISPTNPNRISISWASELGRSYCVAIYLVRRLNSDILLQRLKQKGVRHPDHTRALIKEKLRHDPDSEISTTSLRVSLMCPLGKMRMSVPSRAKTCNHLQCFDAPTFLQMNEKKSTWTCPVCNCTADFDDLLLDRLFPELLSSASDACEIQFSEDGSWQPMKKKEEEFISVLNTSTDVAMIDLTDKDSDFGPSLKRSKSTASTSAAGGGGDFIDLTETNDEDNY